MKILYISKAETADFLCDTLFHGLRSILGEDVVDVNRLWFMYNNGFESGVPWHTFYGLLPDINVDRTDILAKIKSQYFDYIFYGSIHRCRTYLPEVLETYPHSRIVFIDGEDDHDLLAFNQIEPQNIFFPEPPGYKVPRLKFYFKRELSSESLGAIPIQFSIPKEKIMEWTPKIRLMSHMDPRDSSTYIYHTQAEYFRQYSVSCFGYTMKKGGWDCARHVEILAAGAIPYFGGLENCPPATLTMLPKTLLFEARRLCDLADREFFGLDMEKYKVLWQNVRFLFQNQLTTEAMARHVLWTIERGQ